MTKKKSSEFLVDETGKIRIFWVTDLKKSHRKFFGDEKHFLTGNL